MILDSQHVTLTVYPLLKYSGLTSYCKYFKNTKILTQEMFPIYSDIVSLSPVPFSRAIALPVSTLL